MAQAGRLSFLSTYSNQNGGPTSFLNQQQQEYLSHPNYQKIETYPSLPYHGNNNLQIGSSLCNNSWNSHSKIRESTFSTTQRGNQDPIVNKYAYEQQKYSFLTSQGTFPTTQIGNQDPVVNRYAYEQQQSSFLITQGTFPTPQGWNQDPVVNQYAYEQKKSSFPTTQGGNPNLHMNEYATVSAFE